MELERPSQLDPQLISRPSAFDGGFQEPDDVNSKSPQLRRPQEGPVSLLLQELATVMDEMERAQYSPIHTTDIPRTDDDARKQYLSGILTSAWMSSLGEEEEEVERYLNADVKGKNSLLRRLLNHYLQPATLENTSKAFETREDVLDRCQQAIRLVQLVESCGIELGPQWKWDVVVRRIRDLTGRDASVVAMELSRSMKVMADGKAEGGLEEFRARARPWRRSKSQPHMGKA
jgi:hypothetical protein